MDENIWIHLNMYGCM